ncbi:type VI secretion system contractile sheath domain-containing protein [Pyxidicoccus xibeiensis]|uniref:type VI secretion system contractile sheath domain-containing protein n=1 Tax=Pyxidicoccus xibeiensis TaxID=2906759 RepID=UPI0020A811BB|nr:type VI secretion system contractile sheath large subunit [Pyxidicoccus xibeiensis]MCP3136968.1 type VI secretion system contractile sheath large subunit [Pyxidicoccus xibeiensis]
MSQSGSSAEGARVRWLVAGAFSPSPSGRRFHVTSESFASELARAATGLRVTVPDRLGASDTRTVELSFDRLRAFGLADLVTTVPELRALHALHEELSRSDPLRALSAEEAATRVATITGPGRLPDAVAEALRATVTPLPVAPPPPSEPSEPGKGDDLVESLLNRADPSSPAAASRAVDAFLRAINPKVPASSSGSASKPVSASKTARDLVEEAMLSTAKDLLAAEPVAQLESAWRGLKWLVDQNPKGSGLAVEVLDVARPWLMDALQAELAAEPFERPDAVFVVDATDDVGLLGKLAALGERAQVPVVAAVSPSLLGVAPGELSLALEEERDNVSDAWKELRQDESARWLCAVLNRVVATSEGRGQGKRTCFTSPAFAVATMMVSSFRDTGAFARIMGQPGGVRAPSMWELPAGRDKGLSIPTEHFLPIRAQARLEERGIMGLGSGRNTDAVLLAAAPTVYGGGYAVPLPAQLLTGRIVRFATWVRDQLPAGSGGEEVSAIFTQAAEVFLFRGATENGQLRAEVVSTENGRGVAVSATVRPEHAGTRFQLGFVLPLRD